MIPQEGPTSIEGTRDGVWVLTGIARDVRRIIPQVPRMSMGGMFVKTEVTRDVDTTIRARLSCSGRDKSGGRRLLSASGKRPEGGD